MNIELLRYAIWGTHTNPARFKTKDEFRVWAEGMNLETQGIDAAWGIVEEVLFRKQAGSIDR